MNQQLDAILHQPVRTRLVAFLSARGEATFKELKSLLQVTDGNLDAHLRKLTSAGFIVSRKEQTSSKRLQTFYSLTPAGITAFGEYINALQQLLDIDGDS